MNDEALIEQLARAMFLDERWHFLDARPQSEKTPEGDQIERDRMAARWDSEAGKPWHESEWPSFRQKYPRLARAVLPIVKAAQKQAWDECAEEQATWPIAAGSEQALAFLLMSNNPYMPDREDTP